MAITDNNFTPEEFEAAITATPTLLEHLKTVLPKKDFVLTPKADFDKLEDTYIGKHTSKIAGEVENTLKTLTGIEKADANEKWTDYYQRVAKTLKEKSDTLEAEIKPYRENTNLSEAEKQRMKLLDDENKAYKVKISEMETNHKSEIAQIAIKTSVVNEVSGYKSKFNALIPKSVADMAHNAAVSDIAGMGIVEPNTGKVIYMGADKKAIMNGTNFADAEFIYKEKMKDFFDKDKVITGADGVDPDGTTDGLPANIKTQVDLSNYLSGLGLVAGSKEYNEKFTKYSKNLPLR